MGMGEMRRERIGLETNLALLIQRREQLREQWLKLRARRRPSASTDSALARLTQMMDMDRREMEDTTVLVDEMDEQINRAEEETLRQQAKRLQSTDEKLKDELELARAEILQLLRALAGPLRRHQELAKQKKRVSQELTELTNKDNGYANYIDCALLRKPDYSGDLEFVVETLKKARVVA